MNFGIRSLASGDVRAEDSSGKAVVSSLISPFDSKIEDRYGTKFDPKGWVLDNFPRTGFVSLNHMSSFLPIGPLPIGRNAGFEVTSRGLIAKTEFAVDEEEPVGQWARLAFSLVSKGYLRGWSHMFDPLSWVEKDGTKIERARGTSWYERPGRTYTSQELMEYGPVFLAGDGRAETISVGRSAEEARAVHDEMIEFGRRGLDVPRPVIRTLDLYARALAEMAEAEEKVSVAEPAIPGSEEAAEDVEKRTAWASVSLALAARVAIMRVERIQRGSG